MNPEASPYAPMYAGYAGQPTPQPAQPPGWYDPHAVYAAQQQAAYQAWLAARPQPPVYAPQMPEQHRPSWPQQPSHGQAVYPQPQMPLDMQAPQPWPAEPQFAPPAGWQPPQEMTQPPQPQSFQQAQARADADPIDEIRESLREFRDAVRDLAVNRARGRM